MDFLNGSIRSLYFKYLSAAFGSALITCVYSVVDMAMVGQYQGPEGTAALAVVAPVWNIIYSLGLLMGIGGSVIFSMKRGGSENEYFTAAIIGSVLLAALSWIGIIRFERPVLMFFGADEALYVLAQQYLRPIKVVFPLFLFNQMLAAFLRNDKSPGLATLGVLSGGIFNIFGDYFFVFVCDMGIYGAGLATALSMLCPNLYIRIFMSPTPEILRIAPRHHPHIRSVIPAAAAQHILDLLLSGHHAPEGRLHRVCRARARDKRGSDPRAARAGGCGLHMVRHANYGACRRLLRCLRHAAVYARAARGGVSTQTLIRKITRHEAVPGDSFIFLYSSFGAPSSFGASASGASVMPSEGLASSLCAFSSA